MTPDADLYAGPSVRGWPPGAGPLAVLGRKPAWLLNATRRRQSDGSWSYCALVAAEHRERARATLEILVHANWLVTLRPAAPAFLELRLDPPSPDHGDWVA